MKTKLCKKCGVEKPLEEIKKQKGCKDGYSHTCSICYNIRAKEYNKKRYIPVNIKKSNNSKLKKRIRGIILNAIKRNSTKSEAINILGCSIFEFKEHIEKQFEPWMNWNNYGKYNGEPNYGWEYDHILPIGYYKTDEEVLKLNHYSNFRPLCIFTNRRQNGK